MRYAAILRLAFAVLMARSGLPQSIRALNETLDPVPTSRPEALRTIQERAALFSELMQSHPSEALSLALPPAQATRLSAALPEAASLIESQGEWQGSAAVFVEDNFAHKASRTRVWIRTGQEEMEVHFTGNLPALVSGKNVKVRGVRLGKHLAGTLTDIGPAPFTASACATTGEQKIAILMVQFPGGSFPTSIITASQLHDMYFSSTTTSLDGYPVLHCVGLVYGSTLYLFDSKQLKQVLSAADCRPAHNISL